MPMYTCSLSGGHTESFEDDRASNAAKSMADSVWFSEVVPKADEYRVTVTADNGNVTVWDVHVEGIELDLTAMAVR